MTRDAKKVDTCHAAIRDALRFEGFEVADFSGAGMGVPDLAVKLSPNLPGKSIWLECKNPEIKKADQALTKDQERFFYYFNAQTFIVQTPDEALEVVIWALNREGIK